MKRTADCADEPGCISGYAVPRSLLFPYRKSSNARRSHEKGQKFSITHQFHPRYGDEFVFVRTCITWGENRVSGIDKHGTVFSFPINWTSLNPPDEFVIQSDNRSMLRYTDLLDLCALISENLRFLSHESRDKKV